VSGGGVRHLYVHLPFCASRCGYCDFVTVVGRSGQHRAYVDALLRELELERAHLAGEVETIFLGGGTPTFTALPELDWVYSSDRPPKGACHDHRRFACAVPVHGGSVG